MIELNLVHMDGNYFMFMLQTIHWNHVKVNRRKSNCFYNYCNLFIFMTTPIIIIIITQYYLLFY